MGAWPWIWAMINRTKKGERIGRRREDPALSKFAMIIDVIAGETRSPREVNRLVAQGAYTILNRDVTPERIDRLLRRARANKKREARRTP